jgi:aryl-alcohol dehydrogenase-like predicted oxidoreductase
MLPGWVSLAAFARERGVPPRTMRRWAVALDHEAGGGLVRSLHRRGRRPRKYWVNPERLKAALERDPDAKEAERDFQESRLTKNEEKLEALKKAHKALKEQVKQLALDFSRRPSSAIVGHG